MRATIWKVSNKNEKPLRYRLQIDEIVGKRLENRVLKQLSDWAEAGSGYQKETKEATLIFARDFDSTKLMLEWALSFPYELHEQTTRGNTRKIKTSYNKKGAQ